MFSLFTRPYTELLVALLYLPSAAVTGVYIHMRFCHWGSSQSTLQTLAHPLQRLVVAAEICNPCLCSLPILVPTPHSCITDGEKKKPKADTRTTWQSCRKSCPYLAALTPKRPFRETIGPAVYRSALRIMGNVVSLAPPRPRLVSVAISCRPIRILEAAKSLRLINSPLTEKRGIRINNV